MRPGTKYQSSQSQKERLVKVNSESDEMALAVLRAAKKLCESDDENTHIIKIFKDLSKGDCEIMSNVVNKTRNG